jgi:hypothetical protein
LILKSKLIIIKDGFDSVFSIDSLKSFEPKELQLLLSGDQAPSWSYDEIINFTEPKLGYTKDRYKRLLLKLTLKLKLTRFLTCSQK